MILKNLELKGHSGAIYSVDGVGDSIYSGAGDRFVARWNLTLGIQDGFSIKAEQSIYALKLVNEQSELVVGTSSGSIHVIDLVAKKEINHFIQHPTAVFCIAENKQKHHIYTTDASGNLAVWDASNWNLLLFLPMEVGKIRTIFVSPDGKLIFLACQDGTIRILETRSYNEIQQFHCHQGGTNCLHFFPLKPHILVSGGKDGFIRIWNWKTEKCLFEIPAHNFGIYSILFLNDGQLFATASRDKTIKIWNATTLEVLQRLDRKLGGHSHAVNDLCKIDEQHFVSVGDDKRIIVWGF